MIRRCLAVALSLALVVAVSACGNKQATITHADTEGVYVDLGNLQYQIQISRQLNPADVEDSGYVHGVAERLGPGNVWFGVFVRVQNSTNQVQRPARRFVITDTLNNTFTPVAINKYSNPYAYDPVALPRDSVLPNPNATAAQNSINGELLLFKIPFQRLDNRPLVLTIYDPANVQKVATVDLDV